MNIELQIIQNPEVIKKAIMIDDIYKNLIHEDITTWKPDLNTTAFFYAYDCGVPFGILVLERFCSNGVMFHAGVFESQRHKHTPEVLTEIIRMLREASGEKPKVFMTTISVDNIPAIKATKKAGFKEKCIITNASIKGDMMILGE